MRGEGARRLTSLVMEVSLTVVETPPAQQDTPSNTGSDRRVRAWNPRRDPLVWVILGVYFALAVASSFIHELGFGADEISRHLPYVEWLYHERTLPPDDPEVECGSLELHPPLYYALLTPLYALMEPYGRRAALRALRLVSPPLVLVALLFWFAVIRRACADDRRTSLAVLAVTAWWPNLFADASMLTNDVGTLVTLAALLYLMAVRHWERRDLASAAIWGAVVGIGGLVKTSVPVAGAPLIAIGLAWQHGRRFYRDGRFWTRLLLAAAAALAICGWWFARNLRLYGSFTNITPELGFSPIPPGISKLEAVLYGMVWPLLLRAVNGLWVSVFAGAVWFPEWSHPVVYTLLRVITVAGIIGVGLGIWRLATGRLHFARGQAPAIILPAAGFGVLFLSDIYMSVFIHMGFYQGGRYLLPFLPGLTIPLVLGLQQLVPRSWRPPVSAALALLMLALNFLVWYHIITYWNPYVLRTAGPFR